MPQGLWLGPLVFFILIDDLKSILLTHKYVDDPTLSEVVRRGQDSRVQSVLDELIIWSAANMILILILY